MMCGSMTVRSRTQRSNLSQVSDLRKHAAMVDAVWADSSGNGNNGTADGTVLAAGKVGAGSLDFDGIDDHVNVGNIDPGSTFD